MSTVGFVLGAEGSSEGGLFVDKDKQVGCEPWKDCVREEVTVAQQEGLAEDERCYCDVHGVSDVAVEAADDEVLGGEDGYWSAYALRGEAGEGFEHHDGACHYKQNADCAKGREV
jgi:hypothetical protein